MDVEGLGCGWEVVDWVFLNVMLGNLFRCCEVTWAGLGSWNEWMELGISLGYLVLLGLG